MTHAYKAPEGGGLYLIRLSETHFYGGRTTSFRRRWKGHLQRLQAGTHGNPRMQAVFKKYGTFKPEVLLFLAPAEHADAEQEWLDANFHLPGCVNISPHAVGGNIVDWTPDKRAEHARILTGHVRSEESIARQRATFRDRPDLLEKARASLAKNGLKKGYKASATHRANNSAAQQGRTQSPEHVEARAAGHRGRKNTPETLARMSESAKRRAAEKPTAHGEATRALISSQQAGRIWINDGTRNLRLFPMKAELLLLGGAWQRGKAPSESLKGLLWLHRPATGERRRARAEELPGLLEQGWERGQG